MRVKDHLQTGEEVLYQAYPSRLPLAAPLALAAVGAIGLLIAWQHAQPPGVLLLAAAVTLVGLILALVRYLRLSSNQYILTDRRLLRLTGIMSRSSMDSYLDKINNVECHQTFMGRILGFGDLEIDTASDTGAEVFRRIGDPLGFKRAIDAATSTYHRPVGGAVAAATAPGAVTGTGADKIRQLKHLLDEGLISEAEFEAKRKQLLEQI